MNWQPIETAPKDGTLVWGRHSRTPDGMACEPFKTFWGVGATHPVEGFQSSDGVLTPSEPNYVVNGGKPWWLSMDGVKLAPRPDEWKPA